MPMTQRDFLPPEPAVVAPPTPQPTLKKTRKTQAQKPEPEVAPPTRHHMALGVFKTNLAWGVKDRKGEWLCRCVTRREAEKYFNEGNSSFQLIEGCDPWACLDDSPEILVVRKELSDVASPEAVPGAGTT